METIKIAGIGVAVLLIIAMNWRDGNQFKHEHFASSRLSSQPNCQTLSGQIQEVRVFEEKDGILAVEAEHFSSQQQTAIRKWALVNGNSKALPTPDPDPAHLEDASGGAYLELLPDSRVTHDDPLIPGTNFSNEPGKIGILNYKVYIHQPGKYFVWVRGFSTGTEDNGLHVGLDGVWVESGQRMQWCEGKNEWTWESKQRTQENHCGEAGKIFLDIKKPGHHTVSFSMREDGFEFDKWVLSSEYQKPSGQGPQEHVMK